GCGSVGAILGGLLPGYFDTLTVFFVFTATALLASLLLVPFWNSRPGARRVEPKAHAGGPLLAAGKPR
ncbi:MAG: MFS transporter, partial [Pseudomonas aeruginosa]|nr:MFS transporter [Pseudomonas aeruginosa]